MMSGFDVNKSRKGYYGHGIYLSSDPGKADQFTNGGYLKKCELHEDDACKKCSRFILVCIANLGRSMEVNTVSITHKWREKNYDRSVKDGSKNSCISFFSCFKYFFSFKCYLVRKINEYIIYKK